jgi:hypothetical protein
MGTGGRLIPVDTVLAWFLRSTPGSSHNRRRPHCWRGALVVFTPRFRFVHANRSRALATGKAAPQSGARAGGRECGGPGREQPEDPTRSPPAAARQPSGPGQREGNILVVAGGYRFAFGTADLRGLLGVIVLAVMGADLCDLGGPPAWSTSTRACAGVLRRIVVV